MARDVVEVVHSPAPVVDVLAPRVEVVQVVERGRRGPVGPVADLNLVLATVDEAVGDYFVMHPQAFVYDRPTPQSAWVIMHPLDHPPQVTVIDTAGDVVEGVESYPASNIVRIDFNVPVAGRATLS